MPVDRRQYTLFHPRVHFPGRWASPPFAAPMEFASTCYANESTTTHAILSTMSLRLRSLPLSIASFCCPNELRIHLLCQWIIDNILYSIHEFTSMVIGIHLYFLRQWSSRSLARPVSHRQHTLFHPRVLFHGRWATPSFAAPMKVTSTCYASEPLTILIIQATTNLCLCSSLSITSVCCANEGRVRWLCC
jgi:hypothetical protein